MVAPALLIRSFPLTITAAPLQLEARVECRGCCVDIVRLEVRRFSTDSLKAETSLLLYVDCIFFILFFRPRTHGTTRLADTPFSSSTWMVAVSNGRNISQILKAVAFVLCQTHSIEFI